MYERASVRARQRVNGAKRKRHREEARKMRVRGGEKRMDSKQASEAARESMHEVPQDMESSKTHQQAL